MGASFGVIVVLGPKKSGMIEVATFRTEGPYLDGRRPEHVDYSTPEADAWESRALQEVFGSRREPVPVFAAKSYIGNLGAGGSTTELVASLLALQHGQVPATLNYDETDPEGFRSGMLRFGKLLGAQKREPRQRPLEGEVDVRTHRPGSSARRGIRPNGSGRNRRPSIVASDSATLKGNPA